MLFTLFCCFSTGLVVYCILKRVHRKRSIEIAVSLAVREVEKEYESRNNAMIAQLNAKEGELVKARSLVKLHEAVPTMSRGPALRPGRARRSRRPGRAARRPRSCQSASSSRIPLNVFEMSRPFTDTSYDALLATSDVVKIEPAGG